MEKVIDDKESIIRGHVAWALGKIGSNRCMDILNKQLYVESDDYVKEEIIFAKKMINKSN